MTGEGYSREPNFLLRVENLPTPISPYFHTLPDPAALKAALAAEGITGIVDIELFPFSSCSPTFCVRLSSPFRGRRRLVLRGSPQNRYVGVSQAKPQLASETLFFSMLSAAGVSVPDVCWEGRPLVVMATDKRTGRRVPFKFYAMSFLPGMPLDRAIAAARGKRRHQQIDEMARILAVLHSHKGASYGLLSPDGGSVEAFPDFRSYFTACLEWKLPLAKRLKANAVQVAIETVLKTDVPAILGSIERGRYRLTPALVLYDSVGGNMLSSGTRIGIIDVSTAGWYEPMMEFCSLLFSLNRVLLETDRGESFMTLFLRRYTAHGGKLPAIALLPEFLRILLLNDLFAAFLYFGNHRGADKRKKAPHIERLIYQTMGVRKPNWTSLVAAITI